MRHQRVIVQFTKRTYRLSVGGKWLWKNDYIAVHRRIRTDTIRINLY